MFSGSVTGSNDFLEFCESNFFSGKKAIFFLYRIIFVTVYKQKIAF